jgi:hypothetical protein
VPPAREPPLPVEATRFSGPFELYLGVERTDYVAGEDIVAWSNLTWAGRDERVRVGHGSGVVVFSVREVGGDRVAEGGSDSICVTTGWSRDEARTFPWSRSGAWSTDDPTPNDRFVRAYVEDGPAGGLRLPAGTWDLVAATDLYAADCAGDGRHLEVTLRIRVAPATATATPTPGRAADLAPVVRCMHLGLEDCEGAVAIAREARPEAWDEALLVIVDDTCTPGADCDRLFPFDAVVVFVTQPGSLVGSTAVGVVGGTGPEELNPYGGTVPGWVAEAVEAGLRPAPGLTLFPVVSAAPRLPGDVRPCRRPTLVTGILAEDPGSGIGFAATKDHGPVTVSWPFGWSGRRDSDGTVTLVNGVGAEVGRVGEVFEGGGWGPEDATAGICD